MLLSPDTPSLPLLRLLGCLMHLLTKATAARTSLQVHSKASPCFCLRMGGHCSFCPTYPSKRTVSTQGSLDSVSTRLFCF